MTNEGRLPSWRRPALADSQRLNSCLLPAPQPLMLAQPPQWFDTNSPLRSIDVARTALSAAAESGSIEVLTRFAAMPGFTCEMFGAALLAAASQPPGKDATTRELLLKHGKCFPPE